MEPIVTTCQDCGTSVHADQTASGEYTGHWFHDAPSDHGPNHNANPPREALNLLRVRLLNTPRST